MKLTVDDYILILKHYRMPIPRKNRTRRVKKMVHSLLAKKLCRCIKSVKKKKMKEKNAIAICINSILKRRGLKQHRFTCKKRKRFYKKKGSAWQKTRRRLKL